MDGRPNRKNRAAFSNLSSVVWTEPDRGGGGTIWLYRYVRSQRVGFFQPFWSEIGY